MPNTYASICLIHPYLYASYIHIYIQATGRVEARFARTKILAVLLVFLSPALTPVVTASAVMLSAAGGCRAHLATLPFHAHRTNLLRGGVHFAVAWVSLSSVVVAVVIRPPPAPPLYMRIHIPICTYI